jgi:hypothetical protein
MRHANTAVIPANAGIHSFRVCSLCERSRAFKQWIPAFAGMTASLLVAQLRARAELRR